MPILILCLIVNYFITARSPAIAPDSRLWLVIVCIVLCLCIDGFVCTIEAVAVAAETVSGEYIWAGCVSVGNVV